MSAPPSPTDTTAFLDPPPPLSITLRFTSSDPDLTLPIASPPTTTIRHLKTQIRAARPTLSTSRLRLINSGKVLTDSTLLSTLAPLPPPPSTTAPPEPARLWIHVSVGLSLTAAELAAELTPPSPVAGSASAATAAAAAAHTAPAPVGFDRLLSAGFTAPEIAALRDQFAAQNPEAGPDELREIEERWIEEGGEGGVGADSGGSGYSEIFWGVLAGFFWPVAIWALREEGMWGRGRQNAVLAGVGINVLFGLVRLSG
ncbi:DUF2407 C-terminal domain-containing protein [Geopyxis carbonaria]|nr:DUF2407 C-terminal domain-containing protein [Geopyxis carbonaria]